MKVKLKDSIWIEGFVTQTGVDLELLSDNKSFLRDCIFDEFNSNLLYEGKTSEIPEELASQCCKYQNSYEGEPFYTEYGDITWGTYPYETAKESIQSACQSEFCIIYKTR